ncbi:MAG TPA: HAMP domain-containing sensor histidine kinase [Blastocatellia bacterium]
MKLHTKTTLLISAVLVVVFGLFAGIYDYYTTTITRVGEDQRAKLLANRVADTVEEHIRQQRKKGREKNADQESFEPDWAEVQDEIKGTIMKSSQDSMPAGSRVTEVRIWKLDDKDRLEAVRLPEDAGPAPLPDVFNKGQQYKYDGPYVLGPRRTEGHTTLIKAVAPVFFPLEAGGPKMIAVAYVVLSIDESVSLVSRMRRFIWPLMLLAIVSITLIIYFLFGRILYKPIDELLVAMSRAEAGDLAAEVQPQSPYDEIGLLTTRFNRMLARIREMTDELGRHQRGLEDRVREATAEIGERKAQLEEANFELFEMQRQLTQLERLAATGQLAAQFAHEVGTPLNLISGHVQLLRARATDERVIKRLDIIGGQIERITSIVRSMLDSTRKPKPQLEPIDINALLARIFDATQPTLALRGVELKTSIGDQPLRVEADPDQLQQVFINLINNSLDAMPHGGVLHVSTEKQFDRVSIHVSDSGEGIKRDQVDLIFDPLFTTKHGAGTGLGLTIVKQIISEHGGSVEVQSEPGKGTVFTIELPLSDTPFPGEPVEQPAIEAAAVLKTAEINS